MRGWRFFTLALLLVIIILGTTACGSNSSQNQQQVTVTKGDLAIKANGSGKVGVDIDAKPSFGNGGKLTKLNIKEGDKVTKGAVIAQYETDNLELALSQARVAQAQAQVASSKSQSDLIQAQTALTQAQTGLTQAQSAQTQAEYNLTLAQFNLDRIEAVADIKDEMTKLQTQITQAEMLTQDANVRNDTEGALYWKIEKANYQIDLAKQQKKLMELLTKAEYTGVATYEIEGQTYDRLVLEDVRLKQQQVQLAQQAIDQAKQNVEQVKQNIDLAIQNIELAKQNIELAKRTLEQATKAVEVNQKQLTNATILSPIDGTVLTLNVKEGDTISAVSVTTPVYIIDTNTTQVSALVDEIDIPQVKIGQSVIINLDSAPDLKYDGKVKSISTAPVVNPQNSGVVVYEVKVAFASPPPPEVKLGMSSTIDIITSERKDVVIVPNRAVKVDDQGNPVVDVLVNQKTEARLVKLGISDGVETEVISGLSVGDTVVITRSTQSAGLFGS